MGQLPKFIKEIRTIISCRDIILLIQLPGHTGRFDFSHIQRLVVLIATKFEFLYKDAIQIAIGVKY